MPDIPMIMAADTFGISMIRKSMFSISLLLSLCSVIPTHRNMSDLATA